MSMATFTHWYNNATGAGDPLRKIADNARRPARYESPAGQSQFQNDIAVHQPMDPGAYNPVCLRHCLAGEEITAPIPAFLSRVVSSVGFKQNFCAAVDSSPLTPTLSRDPSAGEWTRLDELAAGEEDADALLHVPARVLDPSAPSHRAVFATFDPDDSLEPDGFRSRFHDRMLTGHGANETPADYAVYRLALEDRSRDSTRTETKVLLAYQADRMGTKLYPVPPDAGWHPRFRAITPSDSVPYGRTFPDGSDPTDHAAGRCGENEVVHPNDGIPLDEAYVRSLGSTSCAPS